MQAVVNELNTILEVVIQCATLITLAYALFKFLNAQNHVQDERIESLESWKQDVNSRLNRGDVHFKLIDDGSKVTQKAILALIDHGINGNDIDNLKKAKTDLEDYLTDR